jgi:tyrosyl-tRNA synthetase
MTNAQKLEIIKSVGEEIVGLDELENLLTHNVPLVAYDGFEPSGIIHLPQGLLRVVNINKMVSAGCVFKILVADWHAWANHKYGGDLGKIRWLLGNSNENCSCQKLTKSN